MRTLAAVTLTLLVGAAVSGAAYWGFLSTPESTAWMLGLSALLVLATLAVAALSINVALLLWGADVTRGTGAAHEAVATRDSGTAGGALAARAARGIAACVPALVVLAVAWWLTQTVEEWIAVHNGEISAWFIATAGWADVRWMFTAVAWIGAWVRAVFAPLAGLVWWNAALAGRWLPSRGVVRRAVSFKALALATVVIGLLLWVPWIYLAPWRPRSLSPGGPGEIAFVAIKLALTALLMAVGAALVVRTAASVGPQPPRQPHP